MRETLCRPFPIPPPLRGLSGGERLTNTSTPSKSPIAANPRPIIAQVEGSGMADVDSMLWLKPVIEPSARSTKTACSDMLKGAFASNAVIRLPLNESGSVTA